MNWREKLNKIISLQHETLSSRAYHYLMFIAIIVGILPLAFREQYEIFWYFDLFASICFIVDYILRWLCADMHSKRKSWQTFLVYPFTPMAIIDLLSILPAFSLLNPTFKVTRIPRMLRILRVFKFIRYYKPLETIEVVIHKQRSVLLTVLSLAIFYTLITALIMFNCELEIDPGTGTYFFEDFFDAFYWAACTLTTVGYGDIYPISDVGRLICIISSMVGIAIIALPSGIITAGYLDELRASKEKKDNKE